MSALVRFWRVIWWGNVDILTERPHNANACPELHPRAGVEL